MASGGAEVDVRFAMPASCYWLTVCNCVTHVNRVPPASPSTGALEELRQSDIFSCSRRSRSDNKKGRPVWVALAAWHMRPIYGLLGIPRNEGCNASEQRLATKAVLARVDRCGSGRIDLGCRVWCGHEHQDGPICRCAGQGTSPFTLLQGVNREFFGCDSGGDVVGPLGPRPAPARAPVQPPLTAHPRTRPNRRPPPSADPAQPPPTACLGDPAQPPPNPRARDSPTRNRSRA
jgi:hypothetical protein